MFVYSKTGELSTQADSHRSELARDNHHRYSHPARTRLNVRNQLTTALLAQASPISSSLPSSNILASNGAHMAPSKIPIRSAASSYPSHRYLATGIESGFRRIKRPNHLWELKTSLYDGHAASPLRRGPVLVRDRMRHIRYDYEHNYVSVY